MFETKPWGAIHEEDLEKAEICVMGIPFDGATSCGKGAGMAPEMLRNLSRYLPVANESGDTITGRVYDIGDISFDLNWERYFKTVQEEASNLLNTGKFCLFLGGDHSVTIPLHKAFGEKYKGQRIGIIHFDSHPDVCYEFDGHPWSHACTERRAVEEIVTPSDIAFVGIRSWGVRTSNENEVEFFRNRPEMFLKKAREVYREGCELVAQQLVEKFKNYDAVYFTLDIDVLDPAFAPGTGTPEAGGLSTREVMELAKEIVTHIPVKAMDIVEISPPLDTKNNITSWAALKILYEVFHCVSARGERSGGKETDQTTKSRIAK